MRRGKAEGRGDVEMRWDDGVMPIADCHCERDERRATLTDTGDCDTHRNCRTALVLDTDLYPAVKDVLKSTGYELSGNYLHA